MVVVVLCRIVGIRLCIEGGGLQLSGAVSFRGGGTKMVPVAGGSEGKGREGKGKGSRFPCSEHIGWVEDFIYRIHICGYGGGG